MGHFLMGNQKFSLEFISWFYSLHILCGKNGTYSSLPWLSSTGHLGFRNFFSTLIDLPDHVKSEWSHVCPNLWDSQFRFGNIMTGGIDTATVPNQLCQVSTLSFSLLSMYLHSFCFIRSWAFGLRLKLL